jgi:ABC-type phosphate transport system substrate-binding protein
MKVFKYYIIAILLFASMNAYAQVAVIANKSVSDASISSSKVESVYMLKDKTWSDGKGVILFTLKSDNGTVEKFFSSFGKSSSDMKKLWMKAQLTGEGMAPEALGSEDEVVNKVASTPGAIGYVDANKVNGNVKVLLTIN